MLILNVWAYSALLPQLRLQHLIKRHIDAPLLVVLKTASSHDALLLRLGSILHLRHSNLELNIRLHLRNIKLSIFIHYLQILHLLHAILRILQQIKLNGRHEVMVLDVDRGLVQVRRPLQVHPIVETAVQDY